MQGFNRSMRAAGRIKLASADVVVQATSGGGETEEHGMAPARVPSMAHMILLLEGQAAWQR